MIVKICGIKTMEAALVAKGCGADLIGFVFADSSRQVAVADAAMIAKAVGGVAKVGVFVNRPQAEVNEIAGRCGLDYVQLHGDESPEYCAGINRPVIKALRVGEQLKTAAVEKYDVDYFLLDTLVPGKYGGTGAVFDWRQARGAVTGLKKPFLVAGGLNVLNVSEVIGTLAPSGVDVSGGVETGGVKDAEKIRLFIKTAKAAGEVQRHA